MNVRLRNTVDTAVGYLLALVALALGLVGWIIGLAGSNRSEAWFLPATILAILAIGVVIDEGRELGSKREARSETIVCWLLMLFALCLGIVGFIVGAVLGHDASAWLFSGVILAVVSVGVMADEGRRLRSAAQAVADEAVGVFLSLLAIGVGIVGFVIGVSGHEHAMDWLFAGVIAALVATAFMFDGERRAVAASRPRVQSPSPEVYPRPSGD